MGISEFDYRLSRRADPELEKAIDEVGREKVFLTARQLGWGSETPPSWVWWNIVHVLRRPKTEGA